MPQHSCISCGSTLNQYLWCNSCDRKQLMESWTSGNATYDSIIRMTQKNADSFGCPCLKWIPIRQFKIGTRLTSDDSPDVCHEADWLNGEYLETSIGKGGRVVCVRKSMRVVLICSHNPAQSLKILKQGAETIIRMQESRKWVGMQLVGMSRLESTGQYLMVHASFCSNCGRSYPNNSSWWCNDCDRKELMEGWTSGNPEFDQMIRTTQQKVSAFDDPCLKWAPPYLVLDWVEIGKGGYGTVYSAQWLGAKFTELETSAVNFKVFPVFKELKVAVKVFDAEQDFLSEFKAAAALFRLHNRMGSPIRPLGISRVEATGKYCFIMNYAEHRDLANFLQQNPSPSAGAKIKILSSVAKSLKALHDQNLIHRNIHSGNILVGSQIVDNSTSTLTCALTGYGLSIKKDDALSLDKKVVGVLPYIAPEVLTGETITQAADIYAFGIVMWMLESCDLPFNDRPHDHTLARAICEGLRPEFPAWTPDFYTKLCERCVDTDFRKRPSAHEVLETVEKWADIKCLFAMTKACELQEKNLKKRSKKTHPGAIYTSRPFNFDNLPILVTPKSMSSSPQNLPSIEEVKGWDTPDALIDFLKKPKLGLYLKENHFKFLRQHEIDGPSFLLLTEEALVKDGLKRGPAVKITNLAKEILNAEQPKKISKEEEQPKKKPANKETNESQEVLVYDFANMKVTTLSEASEEMVPKSMKYITQMRQASFILSEICRGKKKKPKNPNAVTVVDNLATAAFGRTASEAYRRNICVVCGAQPKIFPTEVSRREYEEISRICPACWQTETLEPDATLADIDEAQRQLRPFNRQLVLQKWFPHAWKCLRCGKLVEGNERLVHATKTFLKENNECVSLSN